MISFNNTVIESPSAMKQPVHWQVRQNRVIHSQQIEDIDVLRKKGFDVVGIKNQVKELPIPTIFRVVQAPTQYSYGKIPNDLIVLYDEQRQRAKIQSPFYPHDWVQRNHAHFKPYLVNSLPKDKLKAQFVMRRSFLPSREGQLAPMKIDGIPIGFSDGKLVVIPNSNDEFTAGIGGQKGKGKSTFLHAIVESIHHHTNRMQAIINDKQRENYQWWMPAQTEWALTKLRKFSIEPQSLPMIYLYPQTSREEKLMYENEKTFRIAMSWKKCMMNYDSYFRDGSYWAMPESSLMLQKKMREELSNAKNMDEVEQVVADTCADPATGKDPMPTLSASVSRRLLDLHLEGITDLENTIPSMFDFKNNSEYDGALNPLIASMLNGNIPCVDTNIISQRKLFQEWFYYILSSVFEFQTQHPVAKKLKPRIILHCDEITDQVPRKMTRDKKMSNFVVNQLVREGRPARIGFIWATNAPSRVSNDVISNSTYFFAFGSKLDQAKDVVDSYGLDKKHIAEIITLKKHHFLAATTEELWLYDEDGNVESVTEPIICESIPCRSHHQSPAIII